jgi:hypothetical protein
MNKSRRTVLRALDVHKASVIACVRVPGEGGAPHRHEVRKFTTTTRGLLQLRDWLTSFEVELVGMEATGVYWNFHTSPSGCRKTPRCVLLALDSASRTPESDAL